MFTINIKSLFNKDTWEILFQDIIQEFQKWDIIGILWDTWSGKSTFLRLISWLKIDNIFQWDYIISHNTTEDNIIKMSFQDPENQFLFNTVYHEIFFYLNNKEKETANYLLKLFKIKNKKNSLIKDLSSGERKIISLISILSSDNPILLLDEPTANLDFYNINILKNYITTSLHNKIVFIATHEKELLEIFNQYINLKTNKSLKIIERSVLQSSDKSDLKWGNIIEISNINFHYSNKIPILQNINFNIKKWSINIITGGNWIWKSTILQLIRWKHKPISGHIKKKFKSYWFILQEPEKQLFERSVLREIQFWKDTIWVTDDIIKQLELIWLLKYKDLHPFFLSRGQKQLLVTLSVINKEPELLIIDEPFTWLDDVSKHNIINIINQYHNKSHCTILIADHHIPQELEWPYNHINLDKENI